VITPHCVSPESAPASTVEVGGRYFVRRPKDYLGRLRRCVVVALESDGRYATVRTSGRKTPLRVAAADLRTTCRSTRVGYKP
jgi:hypothetical protein